MIARTTIGGSFAKALNYGAGLRLDGTEIEGKSVLLATQHVVSTDAAGIAAEMQAVTQGSRCKLPVWHTSLSWPEGELVTQQKMEKAARMYCEQLGARSNLHQMVIYQHLNTEHPHVHIYLNRVPMDGGKALSTSHNYARNAQICAQISQELSFEPLPKQRQSLKDHIPAVENARLAVNQAILAWLTKKQRDSDAVEDLRAYLREKQIESRFQKDSQSQLTGCSFRIGSLCLTGQQVGYSAKVLQTALTANLSLAQQPTKKVTTKQQPGQVTNKVPIKNKTLNRGL